MPTNRIGLKDPDDEMNLLLAAFNTMTEAVVVYDKQRKALFLNKTAVLLHGIDLTKSLPKEYGSQYGTFLPDGSTACLITELPLFKTGCEENPIDIELYVKRPDGTSTPVKTTCQPLLDRNAKRLGWLVKFIDISQQKLSANELLLFTEALEDYQSPAKIGSWSWDAINDQSHWSNQLYCIFGLDQHSPPPHHANHSNIYTPESHSRLNIAIQTALKTGLFYELNLDAIHSNGTIKKIISRGRVRRDLTGKIVGIFGIVIDITAKKHVNELLKRLIDMIPTPIFVKDANSRFLIINEACKELWGCAAPDLLNTDGSQFFPPEQMQFFLTKDRETWASRSQVSSKEYVWSEKFQENRLCNTLNKPFYDPQGTPLYLISTIEDITERLTVEHSLQETLARLKALHDNLPFLAWMKNIEGYYLLANKHWLQAAGITDPKNLHKLTDFDIWPKKLAKHYQSIDKQVIDTRQPLTLIENTLEEGREIWTETIQAPIIDENNKVLGTIGISKDISECCLAEAQLRSYSERLRLACKAAAIGVCEWNVNTGLANWDDRNYEIFGIPKQTPIDYHTWAKLVFPEDLPKTITKLRQLMAKNHEIHWEFRIHRQNDGALRYIQAAAIAGYNDNGELDKIVGINIDITHFKQIEMDLCEKKAHLAQAQALALLGSWSFDIANNILEWSDECYRIFEMPNGTPLSYQNFIALIHPEDQLTVDAVRQTAKHGKVYDIQYRITINDQIKWLRERAELEFSIDDNLLRGVGTIQDITGLKETEQNLESSRLQIRQLAASCEKAKEDERKRIALEVHDELGQMLSALRMQISLLRIKFASNNQPLLEQIHSILELLDNTIQVTRNVAASLRPQVLEMGIVSALEWLVLDFSKQSGIECELFIPETHVNLNEDSSIVVFRITQESLTNVFRHSAANRVIISITVNVDYYVLVIHDNGQGFDLTKPRESKSFGLIGIQERALMLGGDATIASSAENGTRIQVRIPINSTVTFQ